MTLREAILDAVVDDTESIVQISEYLKFLSIDFLKKDVIELLDVLINEGKLRIAYPSGFKEKSLLFYNGIDELWFEITKEGLIEWNNIKA
jgi:hypothetical protein